jgi:hypothetical protein
MGACETHSDDQRQGPHPKATTQGFLAADDPPPLVGVKLVRPRLRRKRLRLRALQLDTSHAPATVGSYEEAPRTARPSTRTAHNTVGSKQRAPLTRAALMGAETPDHGPAGNTFAGRVVTDVVTPCRHRRAHGQHDRPLHGVDSRDGVCFQTSQVLTTAVCLRPPRGVLGERPLTCGNARSRAAW